MAAPSLGEVYATGPSTTSAMSLPSPPWYVMCTVWAEPRKLAMAAPSARPANVPETGAALSFFTITHALPAVTV